jgi:hypothetical protein
MPIRFAPNKTAMKLVPMCGYQGGKRRYADAIADKLLSFGLQRFYDMGVGSGAVTLALVSKGVPPQQITAIDSGPWGWVWEEIGRGTFDMMYLRDLLEKSAAMDPRDVRKWVETAIAHEPPSAEIFVVLQAASFGSAPVWMDKTGWRVGETGWRYCARGYWEPGPASSETQPRATIFAPEKIVANAERISQACLGLDGRQGKAERLELDPDAVVYVDPPYEGSWGYGTKMDWRSIVSRHRPTVVSEATRIVDANEALELAPRKEGAFKGKNRGRPGEWINVWEGR